LIDPNDQDNPSQAGSSADVPLIPETQGSGSRAESEFLRAILTNLGREICQPLDLLRGGIREVIVDRSGKITEVERSQAETMLALCDDLGRLTRECLGLDESSRD
jgi:hypothetical protein